MPDMPSEGQMAGFEDPNDAPKADSVRGFKCDKCEHLHLALMDENDCCIATAVVSREMLMGMFAALEELSAPTMQ